MSDLTKVCVTLSQKCSFNKYKIKILSVKKIPCHNLNFFLFVLVIHKMMSLKINDILVLMNCLHVFSL